MNILEATESYISYCKIVKNKSDYTVRNYRIYLKRFLEYIEGYSKLESFTVDMITLKLVEAYQLYLHEYEYSGKKLSKKTQSYYLIALRAFLTYLSKKQVRSLPPKCIDLPKVPYRKINALNKGEVGRLLEVVSISSISGLRDKALLELLYSTGLRLGELRSLDRHDIDFISSQIIVRGKGEKIRLVFFNSRAAYHLKRYLEHHSEDPLFIAHTTKDYGKRLSGNSIQGIVRKYARIAGIGKKVTPHVLRHSFATNMLGNGANIRAVQELLGHSSVTTTQLYTHVTNKQLRHQYNKYHT